MLFSVKINWVCTKVDRQCRLFCSIGILGHSNSCISVFPVYGNFVICSIKRFLCYFVCAFIALEIVLNSGWYFHTRKTQKTKKYRTISNIFIRFCKEKICILLERSIIMFNEHRTDIFAHLEIAKPMRFRLIPHRLCLQPYLFAVFTRVFGDGALVDHRFIEPPFAGKVIAIIG